MPLPALNNWNESRAALHQAAQVIGSIKKANIIALPNYAHLGLYVIPTGLTSGVFATGEELQLAFSESRIIYIAPDGNRHIIPIEQHSQMSLGEAVQHAMSDAGSAAQLSMDDARELSLLVLNRDAAAAYQQALYRVYTSLARFRGRLWGMLSPMIVFPHGFDLSFLWFKQGFDERTDPHLNFGFSPGSSGLPRPYVYAYAHPMPDQFFEVELPWPARFVHEPWKGIVIDYDTLVGSTQPDALLEGCLLHIHAAVGRLLV